MHRMQLPFKPSRLQNACTSNDPVIRLQANALKEFNIPWVKLPMLYELVYMQISCNDKRHTMASEYNRMTLNAVRCILEQLTRNTYG